MALTTFYVVCYKPDNSSESQPTIRCLPYREGEKEKADQLAADINRHEPWRQAVVKVETVDVQPYVVPTCWKCGSRKVSDLFKGEYCPRCNDWC